MFGTDNDTVDQKCDSSPNASPMNSTTKLWLGVLMLLSGVSFVFCSGTIYVGLIREAQYLLKFVLLHPHPHLVAVKLQYIRGRSRSAIK